MELTCYLHPGWQPLIRAAEPARDWMTDSPESFAYRCLPLNIANAHGWEILSPCDFAARWNGGGAAEDIEIVGPSDVPPELRPVGLFGQGVLTFHVQGLFRTPPGWNLWIGGVPNRFKDGIAALTGIIETDWAPYTFTMNWRFTRAGHWVSFSKGEPIGFFYPIQRGVLETVTPVYRQLSDAPELAAQFSTWSASRNNFQAGVAENPPARPADKWQKNYYRGVCPNGAPGAADHQAKLRVAEFQAIATEASR